VTLAQSGESKGVVDGNTSPTSAMSATLPRNIVTFGRPDGGVLSACATGYVSDGKLLLPFSLTSLAATTSEQFQLENITTYCISVVHKMLLFSSYLITTHDIPSFTTLIFCDFSMTKNYANLQIHNLLVPNQQQLQTVSDSLWQKISLLLKVVDITFPWLSTTCYFPWLPGL